MAYYQQRSGATNKKNGWKGLNIVEILTSRACCFVPTNVSEPSPLDLLTMKDYPKTSYPTDFSGCNPLHVGLIWNFVDKHFSWVHRTWASACNALPKHKVSLFDEVVKSTLSFKESALEVECCHEKKLDVPVPLGKNILLYILKKYSLKGYGLLHVEHSCECTNVGSNTYGKDLEDLFAASFVGIFLQTDAKEGVNLANKLADGGWASTRFHGLMFARLQGGPGIICSSPSEPHVNFDDVVPVQHQKASTPTQAPLNPLHRLSLKSFQDQILHMLPHQQQQDFPDKEMLDSVQDFFMYTEVEGRRVFEELDRDADGKVTVDDLKVAMKKMKLPVGYAQDFMQRKHALWPAKDFGWSNFSSLIQEKEPVIVQLFNSLGVDKSGTVKRSHVKNSLVRAGLSASEANVTAMMKFLAEGTGDGVKYGQFRRFMLLLPMEELSRDPWSVWLQAATTQGVEASSEDLLFSVLRYVSLVPRNVRINLN